jgi:iron complex outermembrane receptor protein
MKIFWLTTLLIFAVHAEESDVSDLLKMSLEELMEVSVTGSTLTNESLQTVPSAVTVFNRQQIEHLGFDYLHELLDLVPGYQTQREAESSTLYSYSARARRNGSQAKEILVLLDGRMLNDPRTGAANPLMINLDQVEKVEVIRGPGSALYGSAAYTGVINIISRQNAKEVKLGIGSHHRINGHILWSQQQHDWQLDVYAQADQDQGQTYNVDDNFNPRAEVRFDTTDPRQSADVDMALRYHDTLLRLSHRQKATDDFYSIETLANGFSHNSYQQQQINLEQSINWSDAIHSHLTFGWTQTTQGYDAQITAPGALTSISKPSSAEPLLAKVSQKGKLWHLKWHNNWQLSERNSTQFGMEWLSSQETEAKGDNNFNMAQLTNGQFPIEYYGDLDQSTQIGTLGSRRVLGIYAQYLHTLATRTSLTVGLRYDNYHDIATRLSPRLGIVHPFTNNQILKVLYGEAFRAPTLNETGLINNPVILGNPNLTHEIVKTWDIIWLTTAKNIHSSVGWFFNHYDHPISTKIIRNNVRQFANVESSEAQGLELEASYQLDPHWLVRGTFTHFTKLPNTLFREADTLASFLINYEQESWSLNLTGIYHGEREMLTSNTKLTLANHWLFHTKLHYHFTDNWIMSFQIKNLLNEDYQTTLQGNRLTEGVPNRGREWLLGVEYRF